MIIRSKIKELEKQAKERKSKEKIEKGKKLFEESIDYILNKEE